MSENAFKRFFGFGKMIPPRYDPLRSCSGENATTETQIQIVPVKLAPTMIDTALHGEPRRSGKIPKDFARENTRVVTVLPCCCLVDKCHFCQSLFSPQSRYMLNMLYNINESNAGVSAVP